MWTAWICPRLAKMTKGEDSGSRVLTTELNYYSNPTEYMSMEESFSPVSHRVNQAIRWRAVHPNEPVPPPYEILTKFSKPPEELQASAKRYLEKLVAAAEVKKGNYISYCLE